MVTLWTHNTEAVPRKSSNQLQTKISWPQNKGRRNLIQLFLLYYDHRGACAVAVPGETREHPWATDFRENSTATQRNQYRWHNVAFTQEMYYTPRREDFVDSIQMVGLLETEPCYSDSTQTRRSKTKRSIPYKCWKLVGNILGQYHLRCSQICFAKQMYGEYHCTLFEQSKTPM